MSYRHQVFLSHSHDDDAFAKSLARMLKDAHLEVWIDDYGIGVGDEILPAVEKALEESQHAIFVVTESWLQGKWTKWEVKHFDSLRKAGTDRRMVIPILRGVEELPPYFDDVHFLRWSAEDDARPDALFWQLFCGLTGQKRGEDEGEWAEKGRRQRGLGPERGPVLNVRTPEDANFKTAKRSQWGGTNYALSCDRFTQWGVLSTELGNPNDEAIFVVGPHGRAHDRFLQRVEEHSGYPDDQIKPVKWSKRQRTITKRAFKDRLARAVGCKDLDEKLDERLEVKLADALQTHNLLLLHRPVCTREIRNETFVSYYTEVLPELIARVRRRKELLANARTGENREDHGVKIIQAIAWDEPSPLQRRLVGLLHRLGIGGKWARRAGEYQEARATLERICNQAGKQGLTVLSLQELEEITREHVVELSRRLPVKLLKPEERDDFVEDVMASARDSDQIFNKITEWLKEDDDEGDSSV